MRTSFGLVASFLVARLFVGNASLAAAQDHTRVKNPAARGEQAPPADPGQNNFGGPICAGPVVRWRRSGRRAWNRSSGRCRSTRSR